LHLGQNGLTQKIEMGGFIPSNSMPKPTAAFQILSLLKPELLKTGQID